MLLNLITYSLLTACLAWFVQYALQPGEILGRYGLLLTAVWMRNWRRKDRWKRALMPALGLCPFCNGSWLAMVVYLTMARDGSRPWLIQTMALFLFLGANYIWTKILSKVAE